MPGSPPSAGTTSPESSASAGNRAPQAAACALSAAFASKVAPVSSGSGRPSAPTDSAEMPKGRMSSAISRNLPGLWVAITSLPMTARCIAPAGAVASGKSQRPALRREKLANPLAGEFEHAGKARLVARGLLGGGLDLDDPAAPGQHEITVGMRPRVLHVIEGEYGRAIVDSTGYGGERVRQRQRGDYLAGEQAFQRDV